MTIAGFLWLSGQLCPLWQGGQSHPGLAFRKESGWKAAQTRRLESLRYVPRQELKSDSNLGEFSWVKQAG